MSRAGDLAKMESILKYIADIETICGRHGSAKAAMDDVEGRYAVLMCVFQIGECLGKMETEDFVRHLPIQAATGMRNILAHNYEGIEGKIAIRTVEDDLPKLRTTIVRILKTGETGVL